MVASPCPQGGTQTGGVGKGKGYVSPPPFRRRYAFLIPSTYTHTLLSLLSPAPHPLVTLYAMILANGCVLLCTPALKIYAHIQPAFHAASFPDSLLLTLPSEDGASQRGPAAVLKP